MNALFKLDLLKIYCINNQQQKCMQILTMFLFWIMYDKVLIKYFSRDWLALLSKPVPLTPTRLHLPAALPVQCGLVTKFCPTETAKQCVPLPGLVYKSSPCDLLLCPSFMGWRGEFQWPKGQISHKMEGAWTLNHHYMESHLPDACTGPLHEKKMKVSQVRPWKFGVGLL